jgi:phosphatidylserine decarboxylase
MSFFDTVTSTLAPVHREGWPFVAIIAAIALVLFWLDIDFLGWIAVIAALWCAYFFRDPERVTPLRSGLVISPADGRISAIEDVIPPPELDLERQPVTRISIFMNIFDVHVNRAPLDATVSRIAYVPGKFVNADLDKASEDNERNALTLDLDDGRKLGVVQIAGLIARRIVRFVNERERLLAGQRIGLIRFGSRVDVYLPQGVHSFVAIDQRVIGGETVIADLLCDEPERIGRRS